MIIINFYFISLFISSIYNALIIIKRYYLQKEKTISKFQIKINITRFNRDIYLINNPLFKNRSKYIKFAREEYKFQYRGASNSLVISTFERPECFKQIFQKVIAHRPPQTEIVICDDASRSTEKIQLLKEIADNYSKKDVYVIIHTQNFGSFHTKLDGFLFSAGEFIMSIDDDDDFNSDYYFELASNINKLNSSETTYDFIIPRKNKAFYWVRFPVTIRKMIESYHNHVSFAFRRNLMKIVNYPDQTVKIYRDDAPLMIPLYIQSDDSKLYHYINKNQYIIRGLNCSSVHEVSLIKIKEFRQFFFNGLLYIMNFTRKYGNFQYINSYKRAYPDRDIPRNYFNI